MGILYLLTFPNNKRYVGQTVNSLQKRWTQHKSKAKNNPNEGCVALNHAIRKYGAENVKILQISEVDNDKLDLYENYYIAKVFHTLTPQGYNLQTGGSALKRHSKKTLLKMSKSAFVRDSTKYRKSKQTIDLPKYVGIVKNGYRISKHPNCSCKTFANKNKTMKENLKDALKFLKKLNDGIVIVKHDRILPEGIQKMGYGFRIFAFDPKTKKRIIKNYANTMLSKRILLKQAIEYLKKHKLVWKL
jgi:hypothetical protein